MARYTRSGQRHALLRLLAIPVVAAATITLAAGPAASANAAPRQGVWQKLPAAPVAQPGMPVSVWTGHEMIVHGNRYPSIGVSYGVTFAYRPATRTWVRLAAGPRPANAESTDIAVWTGSRMLVIGLTGGSYDPATNTWRAIPNPSMSMVGAVTGWTGKRVLVWGGNCCAGTTRDGQAFDPATNSWRALPAAPLQARANAEGAWTGKELVVAGGESNGIHPTIFRDGAAYNPATGKWRKLPAMPGTLSWGRSLWDGSEVLFLSSTGARGMAYNPAVNRWRLLPAMPLPRKGFIAVWTGRQVLVWGGLAGSFPTWQPPAHGEIYTPAINRWSALPASPLHGRANPLAVWTRSQMMVWGGDIPRQTTDTLFNDGAIFTP